MKKGLFVLLVTGLITVSSNAQDAPPPPPQVKPAMKMSREEMEKMKKKRDEEITESLKEVGLPEEKIKEAKEVIIASGMQMKDMAKDPSLTEEQKKEKRKELFEAQKEKLKAIMGAEKLKQWWDNKKKNKKDGEQKGKAPAPAEAPMN